jgi:uncharacterized phage protein (TIGR01671 family)
MREIKFRAWDTEDKKFENYFQMNNLGILATFDPMIAEWGRVKDGRYILMQYTGLKDKNGKEIYEGDVVRDCDTSDCVFEVKWHDKAVGYYMPDEFDEEYAYPMSQVKLEVIGNIYENPDLLAPTPTEDKQ